MGVRTIVSVDGKAPDVEAAEARGIQRQVGAQRAGDADRELDRVADEPRAGHVMGEPARHDLEGLAYAIGEAIDLTREAERDGPDVSRRDQRHEETTATLVEADRRRQTPDERDRAEHGGVHRGAGRAGIPGDQRHRQLHAVARGELDRQAVLRNWRPKKPVAPVMGTTLPSRMEFMALGGGSSVGLVRGAASRAQGSMW